MVSRSRGRPRAMGMPRCGPLAFVGMLLAFGCSGQPVSVTVQAGGSIVVPLTIESIVDGAVVVTSWGTAHARTDGTRFEDPQRGELVLKLEDGDADPENDVELVTRAVFVAEAPVESAARNLQTGLGRRLLLVADVPSDAPLGTHALTLVHRRVVEGVPVDSSPLEDGGLGDPVEYFGEIKILPPSLQIPLPDGSQETAVGTPHPDRFFMPDGTGFAYGSGGLQPELAMPAAAIAITVTFDPVAAGSGQYPGFLKLALDYPAEVIDVHEVVLAESTQGRAWFEDDGAGGLTVYGLAFRKANPEAVGVGPIQVIFSLDDPEAQLLDAGDLSVELLAVADQLGEPVDPVAWGLVVHPLQVH